MTYNGKAFNPVDTSGVSYPPITYKDRTYIPARFVAERAGMSVDWDEASQTVIFRSGNDLLNRARLAAEYLKAKDYIQLSELVHPTKGLTFSPYSYVEKNSIRLNKNEVKSLRSSTKVYLWGYYDGSGEPMNLKFADYNGKFIFDHDYTNATRIGNNTVIQYGNTTVDMTSTLGNAIRFIEFNFPGTEQYEGMDWSSLRLVFEQYNGEWLLVGVVHDQWTI